jgi:hypothetical protein
MTKIRAQTTLSGWDEEPYATTDEAVKFSRADVTMACEGDLAGDMDVKFLMAYAADGSATYVGLQRFSGTLQGRAGSLAMQAMGTFTDGVARSKITVLPGASTGELAGTSGSGTFEAETGPNGTLTLDVELA